MVVALITVLGGVAGAFTPYLTHRFAVEPATPSPTAACRIRPPSRGLAGRVRPSAHHFTRGSSPRDRPWIGGAAGAASFGLLAVSLAGDPALPAFLAVAAVGVPLAAVDLACLRLPDPLVAAAGSGALLGLAAAALALGTPQPLLRALAAGLCCTAGYAVLALLPGSRLGFGDVKLAGVLGLPLGWLGWPAVLLGLGLPHVLNGTVALVLLLSRRADRHTALPFGPALLLGALLAVPLA